MIRQRTLPAGWYPQTGEGVNRKCDEYLLADEDVSRDALAVIAPHAGWEFSGKLACRSIHRLDPAAGTVVVVGGHLRPGDPVTVCTEDGFSTPLGDLAADLELVDLIRGTLDATPDTRTDNTVEIQLPFVAHALPGARVVCVRSPPSAEADRLGTLLAAYRRDGHEVVVVGSTDLTHYGSSYNFLGHGRGVNAVNWVKTVNDRQMISAFVSMKPQLIVSWAIQNGAACSSGAAAAAAVFAAEFGCTKAEVVGYYTSHDIIPAESFVGYAGVAYRSAVD